MAKRSILGFLRKLNQSEEYESVPGYQAMWNRVAAGAIPATKIDGHWYIDDADEEKIIASLKLKPRATGRAA